MTHNNDGGATDLDRLRTFKEAADLLGLPYFKIQRAARLGLVPTYRLFNSRKYVRASEILACMAATANS
ncbi:hypothetical protein [Hansschlegelia sp.]|uniref:hypothetical protein n=1 Tax=Hansschlegelia sp. TaxID=2041892 RepID=UPI002C0B7795|nr:hypothetical protein [Hansschlegelia sp.]HVI30171.1 hypothetical protein [Hansschlegelia sp.]